MAPSPIYSCSTRAVEAQRAVTRRQAERGNLHQHTFRTKIYLNQIPSWLRGCMLAEQPLPGGGTTALNALKLSKKLSSINAQVVCHFDVLISICHVRPSGLCCRLLLRRRSERAVSVVGQKFRLQRLGYGFTLHPYASCWDWCFLLCEFFVCK
jgi:hypothetical protein